MATLRAERVPTARRATPQPLFVAPAGLPRGGRIRFVDVPERRCLAIEGTGEPGGAEFQGAIGALYSTVYAVHFLLRHRGNGAKVGYLEALWEPRDGSAIPTAGDFVAFQSADWRWTLLMALPEEATDDDVASAMAVARRKHPSPALNRLVVLTIREGHAVEAVHVGPYATEPETIARMHAAAAAEGLTPVHPHHEVYLGDPRRSRPDRLRTLLRHPVR
jgi:hypothetical protein